MEYQNHHSINKIIRMLVYGVAALLGAMVIFLWNSEAKASDYEDYLAEFPEDYQEALEAIHEEYPNYIFKAVYIDQDFDTVVDSELKLKQVYAGDSNSWKGMFVSAYGDHYDWDNNLWITSNNGWVPCAREVLEFFVDPRNYLTTDFSSDSRVGNIYAFAQQSYDPENQTLEGLQSVIAGSFLAGTYTPNPDSENDVKYGGSYAAVIMKAAQESGVSPYVIAATIRIESGVNGTSGLCSGTYSGYEGYYNFYGWKAYGSDVIGSGLEYAKEQGWDNRYDAIVGGAKLIGANYTPYGQDTYYFTDYNVTGSYYSRYTHQYASAVYDCCTKGRNFGKAIVNDTSCAMTFLIPVYNNMPDEPAEYISHTSAYNNYYFLSMSCDGGSLSPSFDMFTNEYKLSISDDSVLSYTIPDGASYTGKHVYYLNKGSNKISLVVQSQSGFERTYTITVNASKVCSLIIGNPSDVIKFVSDSSGRCVTMIDNQIYENADGIIEGIINGQIGWWYVKNGVVQLSVSGLTKSDGVWWYLKNGRVYSEFTGLAKNSKGWWYVVEGQVNLSYTGFASNSKGDWYCVNGKVDFDRNDVVKGTVKGVTGYWYVQGGKVAYSSGLTSSSLGWCKILNGMVDEGFSGMVTNSKGTWQVVNGWIDFKHTGLYKYDSRWWYTVNSKAQTDFTGFVSNSKGNWYVKAGLVDMTVSGLVKGKENGSTAWHYVTNGKVDATFTGFVSNSKGDWYLENGNLDFTRDEVVKAELNGVTAWWYVNGGKVSYTTCIGTNSKGTWYVEEGKVTLKKTGLVKVDSTWWYVVNSRVKTSFTGIVSNSKGSWYVKSGKIDTTYSGVLKIGQKTYIIVKGKVL